MEFILTCPNGKKIDSQGKELYNLVPIYRLSSFDATEESWEETISAYQECSLKEGYKKESNLDEAGLLKAAEFLAGVDKSEESKTPERDPNAGKNGPAVPRSPSTTSINIEKDPLADLKKQGMTISSMLPLLVILSKGQYTEIDDLINNTDDEVFVDWLTHCGVKYKNTSILNAKHFIIEMLNF